MSTDLTPGTDLAVIDPADVEAAADPAEYVVQACERAKTWLAHALEHGGIDEIVELKSQAEAIRIYTMQKQLGKDAELSAAEIVRRAERGIGIAIRRGQEAGEIAVSGTRRDLVAKHNEVPLPTTTEVAQVNHRSDLVQVYAMTDGVSDEQFDGAVDEGKAEGNLSRANVVRKVRAKRDAQEAKTAALVVDEPSDGWIPPSSDKGPEPAFRRRELIRAWAKRGWTSTQMGQRLEVLPETIRRIARDEDISISADDALGRGTRKSIDSNRIVRETVNGLEGLEIALDLVSFEDLDRSEIEHWTTSLTTSIRILNRLNKRLKEIVQ